MPSSMRRTLASVGGMTGRPSDQPRSKAASNSSSSDSQLDAAGAEARIRRTGPGAGRSSTGRPRASRSPVAARVGRVPRPSSSVKALPLVPRPTDDAVDLDALPRPGAGSAPSRSRGATRPSSSVSSTTVPSDGGERRDRPGCRRSTSRRRLPARWSSTGTTSSQVGQSRLTTATRPLGRVGRSTVVTVVDMRWPLPASRSRGTFGQHSHAIRCVRTGRNPGRSFW